MTRDLTQRQFDAACEKYGFAAEGFMGYYSVGNGLHVSVYNAGDNRRARLAYLMKASKRAQSFYEDAQTKGEAQRCG